MARSAIFFVVDRKKKEYRSIDEYERSFRCDVEWIIDLRARRYVRRFFYEFLTINN